MRRVRAAVIKEYGAPLDVLCATGTSYFGAPPLSYVPGVQGAGRVVQASSVPEGSRVWFPATAGMRPGDGSMAELALAAEAELVILPDAVEDTPVAALGLSAVAAWMALTWRARMLPREQVLVLGPGGVVGQVAVQAAKRLGARRVVAACRSEAAQERARVCGADAVVPLYDHDDEVLARPTRRSPRRATRCRDRPAVRGDRLCRRSAAGRPWPVGQPGQLGEPDGPVPF